MDDLKPIDRTMLIDNALGKYAATADKLVERATIDYQIGMLEFEMKDDVNIRQHLHALREYIVDMEEARINKSPDEEEKARQSAIASNFMLQQAIAEMMRR